MMLRTLLLLAVVCFFSGTSFAATSTIPDKWIDAKYCGKPARNPDGTIKRSQTAIKYFKLQNPCPGIETSTGACTYIKNDVTTYFMDEVHYYRIDHTRPLASCGCDTPTNMGWMKDTIKSCAGTECKDRFELIAYKCKPEDL